MKAKRLLYLAAIITMWLSAAGQVQIEILDIRLNPACVYSRLPNILIWHCPDSVVIYDASSNPQKSVISLEGIAKNLRILPCWEKNLIYLLRDSQILRLNLNTTTWSQDSLTIIFNSKVQMFDFSFNIQVEENYIVYKEKHHCTLRRLDIAQPIHPTQLQALNIKVFQYFDDGEDCNLNFTTKLVDNLLNTTIYIKDINSLIFHSFNYLELRSLNTQSYVVLPSLFRYQFQKFEMIHSIQYLLFLTFDNLDSMSCIYLLSQAYFDWRLEYNYCEQDIIVKPHITETDGTIGLFKTRTKEITILNIKRVLLGAPVQVHMSSSIKTGGGWPTSSTKLNLYPASYLTNITKSNLDILNNYQTFYYCLPQKKITLQNACHDVLEPNIDCTEYLEVMDAINLFKEPTLSSCSVELMKDMLKICPTECTKINNDCSNCISSKLGPQCLGYNPKLACKDPETPIIVKNNCDMKQKKYNGAFQYNLYIQYAENQNIKCHIAFDFGILAREAQLSFWRSNESLSLYSDLNLEMYNAQGSVIQKLNKVEGLTFKAHFYRINSIYIDYRIHFRSEVANKYAVLTIAPIPTTYSCLACVMPKLFVGPLAQSNSNAWMMSEYKCVEDADSEGLDVVRSWPECFLQEISATSSTLCEVKEENKNQMIISFKDNFEYPYCNIPISLKDKPGLKIQYSLEDYEDIALEVEEKFFSLRNIIESHDNKISQVIPLSKINQINLLFLSRDGIKTSSAKKSIIISFGPDTTDTLSVIGLVVINALGVLLVICICLCRASAELGDTSNDTPYEIAAFQSGSPKKVKLTSSQVKQLFKQGINITNEGSPVSLEACECCICLELVTEREYRVFLCGRHYVHLDCFDTWIEAQIENGTKEICPLRCKDILIYSGDKKKKAKINNSGSPSKSTDGSSPVISISPIIQPGETKFEETIPTIVLHSLDNLPEDQPKINVSFDNLPYKSYQDDKSISILNFNNRSDMPLLETEENNDLSQITKDHFSLNSLDDITTRKRQSSLRFERQQGNNPKSPINGLKSLSNWELDIDLDRERSASNVGLLDGRSNSPDPRDPQYGFQTQEISEEGSSIDSEEASPKESSTQRQNHESQKNHNQELEIHDFESSNLPERTYK